MFHKDLFLALCRRYEVPLSQTATRPMININPGMKSGNKSEGRIAKDSEQIREITKEDARQIFSLTQISKH